MKGPKILQEWENRWITNVGKWFPSERTVLRGHDLLSELGEEHWMKIFLLGITGRNFSDEQVRLFEGIWVIATSYPDPRIWPNRVAALAGTSRSTSALAAGAALASSEGILFGGRNNIRNIDQWLRFLERIKNGEDLRDVIKQELKTYRSLAGFGRPVSSTDERITPMMKLARSLKLGDGPHVHLAFEVEQLLQKMRYRTKINIAGLGAALAADQGMSREEYYYYITWCFSAGLAFAYVDTASKPEGLFFPIRCERIKSKEHLRRQWQN